MVPGDALEHVFGEQQARRRRMHQRSHTFASMCKTGRTRNQRQTTETCRPHTPRLLIQHNTWNNAMCLTTTTSHAPQSNGEDTWSTHTARQKCTPARAQQQLPVGAVVARTGAPQRWKMSLGAGGRKIESPRHTTRARDSTPYPSTARTRVALARDFLGNPSAAKIVCLAWGQ